MTRRVATERVVSAVPRPRRAPKPLREPRTPRVVELLRKAMEWRDLIESGAAPNQADIARREGITRARVTQIMSLLRLAPEIRRHILALPMRVGRPPVTERALRQIALMKPRRLQVVQFEILLPSPEVEGGRFPDITSLRRN